MIYAIGLESEFAIGPGRIQRTRPDRGLRKLAEETGGGYFELKKTAELAPTFTRVAAELHSLYAIGFTADGGPRQRAQARSQDEPGRAERAGAQGLRRFAGRVQRQQVSPCSMRNAQTAASISGCRSRHLLRHPRYGRVHRQGDLDVCPIHRRALNRMRFRRRATRQFVGTCRGQCLRLALPRDPRSGGLRGGRTCRRFAAEMAQECPGRCRRSRSSACRARRARQTRPGDYRQ